MLIWNLIWHPGVFDERFERHYYCWKLNVGAWVSLICDWKQLSGIFCSDLDWNSFFIGKPDHYLFFKSSFNSFLEVLTSWTTENNDAYLEKVSHWMSSFQTILLPINCTRIYHKQILKSHYFFLFLIR